MSETMQSPTPEQHRVAERQRDPVATAEQVSRIAFKLLQRAGEADFQQKSHDAKPVKDLEITPLEFSGPIGDEDTIRSGNVRTKNANLRIFANEGGANTHITTSAIDKRRAKSFIGDTGLHISGRGGENTTAAISSKRTKIARTGNGSEYTYKHEPLGANSELLSTTRDINAEALSEVRTKIAKQEARNKKARAEQRAA